ncbi:GNAT family N-acetyltransferase [bacterium]|jgi:diamine N-acetyltransferase|nr:GNAT family N-acetyltransferase [bacterium]
MAGITGNIERLKMKLLSSEWQTENLLIKTSKLSECALLQKLYEEFREKLQPLDGQDPPAKNTMYKTLTEGDLPPNGKKENFQFMSILNGKETIGFLAIYHGYPEEDILQVPYLYIKKNYQNQGFGQKVIFKLFEEAKKAAYEKIQLVVGVKNWPGIRFWLKMEFDKILNISGDKKYSHNSFADLHLEKKL